MAITITGDLDWTGDLILFLQALDGGPAADVAGYAFTSSGDLQYSCSVPEPIVAANRLSGTYRCVAKVSSAPNAVKAGVGYVKISADTTAVRITAEIGGSSSQAVSLFLGAAIPLSLGQVSGFDQELVVGDSYTEEVGRTIPVSLVDANGDAVSTQFGSKSLSDSGCTIRCLMHPENARNTGSVKASAEGTCAFVAAVGQTPAMLSVSLSREVTSKLTPGVYGVQFRADWSTGESVTLAWKGSVTFVRRLMAN